MSYSFESTQHSRLCDNSRQCDFPHVIVLTLYIIQWFGTPSIPYWNASGRIAFALLMLFASFHSIRMKRAESHIRFALEPTPRRYILQGVPFFLLFFLYFASSSRSANLYYSEYCITSRLRNHDEFYFLYTFFYYSRTKLPVLFNFYRERIHECFRDYFVELSDISTTGKAILL